jgi:hypothetical protein
MEVRKGMMGNMTERELVAQIETMRDDPEAWGVPEPEPEPGRKRKSERRQRGALVSVRFTPDELAVVQAHAAEAGTSVSGYLRDIALEIARRPAVTGTWFLGSAVINVAGTEERFLVRETKTCA